MRDIIPDIDRWLMGKKDVALATVVQTWGCAAWCGSQDGDNP